MRAFRKKFLKIRFQRIGRKIQFSENHQKLPYLDKILWPNPLT